MQHLTPLQKGLQAYEELSSRERLMLLLATILVVSLASTHWLIQPLRKQRQQLASAIEATRLERDTLRRLATQPPAAMSPQQLAQQAEMQRLEAVVKEGEALLKQAQRHRELDVWLQRLSAVEEPAVLESIRLESPRPLSLATTTTTTLPTLHTRDIQVAILSDYAYLTRYLQRLEGQNTPWFWQAAELSAPTPPRNRLRITLRLLTDEQGATSP